MAGRLVGKGWRLLQRGEVAFFLLALHRIDRDVDAGDQGFQAGDASQGNPRLDQPEASTRRSMPARLARVPLALLSRRAAAMSRPAAPEITPARLLSRAWAMRRVRLLDNSRNGGIGSNAGITLVAARLDNGQQGRVSAKGLLDANLKGLDQRGGGVPVDPGFQLLDLLLLRRQRLALRGHTLALRLELLHPTAQGRIHHPQRTAGSSASCCCARRAPTGPSSSTPANAPWSAPRPSDTSACATAWR